MKASEVISLTKHEHFFTVQYMIYLIWPVRRNNLRVTTDSFLFFTEYKSFCVWPFTVQFTEIEHVNLRKEILKASRDPDNLNLAS
jgi:hypothetical protein